MKHLFQLLFLCMVAKATTLTGTLPSPLGGNANGTLVMTVSQPATVANNCAGSLPGAPYRFTVTSGVATGTVIGNDCLVPNSTSYNVTLTDTNGNVFNGVWKVLGTTFNLSNQIFGIPGQINTTQSGNNFIQQPAGTNLSINNLEVNSCVGCGRMWSDSQPRRRQ